jgi:hypothetical protein
MNASKKEPMVSTSTQVHTTKDYHLFKSIDGNRTKNLMHINRLKKSIESNYLFTIITVNEKYEIIDGQHRFDVIKELNLPLNYVICKGYGLHEVHVLNENSKTWSIDDYLDGYCKLGYKQYLKYAEFKNKYGFNHGECMMMLSDKSKSGGDLTKIFYRGEFEIKNYKESCDLAEKISMIGQYYSGYKRRSFVFAMLSLFKNEKFEFTELIQKLKLQQTALIDCVNAEQYLALIEEIYNYRRREKVNLRY